ncbi:MAG: hypothetical protein ACYDEN_06195, partial [Acidimicrobiales bacterium]
LRGVADRMAALDLGVLPVVDRTDTRHLDGLVSQFDLFAARQKLLEEERHAERVLTLRRVRGGPAGARAGVEPARDDDSPSRRARRGPGR